MDKEISDLTEALLKNEECEMLDEGYIEIKTPFEINPDSKNPDWKNKEKKKEEYITIVKQATNDIIGKETEVINKISETIYLDKETLN